eukprot:TRINITY_DN22918_c0_g1_i1.p1 TRINITY_DN22918_c0_g1~~TRINITY_DN22918_c0_g1_i1.p1  ORF type:complete len:230 (+),score=35.78 TRINITY_DN22918_c0_g1_i1:83-772(+)
MAAATLRSGAAAAPAAAPVAAWSAPFRQDRLRVLRRRVVTQQPHIWIKGGLAPMLGERAADGAPTRLHSVHLDFAAAPQGAWHEPVATEFARAVFNSWSFLPERLLTLSGSAARCDFEEGEAIGGRFKVVQRTAREVMLLSRRRDGKEWWTYIAAQPSANLGGQETGATVFLGSALSADTTKGWPPLHHHYQTLLLCAAAHQLVNKIGLQGSRPPPGVSHWNTRCLRTY